MSKSNISAQYKVLGDVETALNSGAVTVEVRKYAGGRRYTVTPEGKKPIQFSIKELIHHTLALAKDPASHVTKKQLEGIVGKLETLDQLGAKELDPSKTNLLARLLTQIRSLFGNIIHGKNSGMAALKVKLATLPEETKPEEVEKEANDLNQEPSPELEKDAEPENIKEEGKELSPEPGPEVEEKDDIEEINSESILEVETPIEIPQVNLKPPLSAEDFLKKFKVASQFTQNEVAKALNLKPTSSQVAQYVAKEWKLLFESGKPSNPEDPELRVKLEKAWTLLEKLVKVGDFALNPPIEEGMTPDFDFVDHIACNIEKISLDEIPPSGLLIPLSVKGVLECKKMVPLISKNGILAALLLPIDGKESRNTIQILFKEVERKSPDLLAQKEEILQNLKTILGPIEAADFEVFDLNGDAAMMCTILAEQPSFKCRKISLFSFNASPVDITEEAKFYKLCKSKRIAFHASYFTTDEALSSGEGKAFLGFSQMFSDFGGQNALGDSVQIMTALSTGPTDKTAQKGVDALKQAVELIDRFDPKQAIDNKKAFPDELLRLLELGAPTQAEKLKLAKSLISQKHFYLMFFGPKTQEILKALSNSLKLKLKNTVIIDPLIKEFGKKAVDRVLNQYTSNQGLTLSESVLRALKVGIAAHLTLDELAERFDIKKASPLELAKFVAKVRNEIVLSGKPSSLDKSLNEQIEKDWALLEELVKVDEFTLSETKPLEGFAKTFDFVEAIASQMTNLPLGEMGDKGAIVPLKSNGVIGCYIMHTLISKSGISAAVLISTDKSDKTARIVFNGSGSEMHDFKSVLSEIPVNLKKILGSREFTDFEVFGLKKDDGVDAQKMCVVLAERTALKCSKIRLFAFNSDPINSALDDKFTKLLGKNNIGFHARYFGEAEKPIQEGKSYLGFLSVLSSLGVNTKLKSSIRIYNFEPPWENTEKLSAALTTHPEDLMTVERTAASNAYLEAMNLIQDKSSYKDNQEAFYQKLLKILEMGVPLQAERLKLAKTMMNDVEFFKMLFNPSSKETLSRILRSFPPKTESIENVKWELSQEHGKGALENVLKRYPMFEKEFLIDDETQALKVGILSRLTPKDVKKMPGGDFIPPQETLQFLFNKRANLFLQGKPELIDQASRELLEEDWRLLDVSVSQVKRFLKSLDSFEKETSKFLKSPRDLIPKLRLAAYNPAFSSVKEFVNSKFGKELYKAASNSLDKEDSEQFNYYVKMRFGVDLDL